jgi:hypothetical protein
MGSIPLACMGAGGTCPLDISVEEGRLWYGEKRCKGLDNIATQCLGDYLSTGDHEEHLKPAFASVSRANVRLAELGVKRSAQLGTSAVG